MNKISSIVTGGVTLSAVQLAPLVQWAINGFPKPVPDGTPLLIAAGIVTGAHLLYNIFAERFAAKESTAMPALALPAGTQVTYSPPVPVLNSATPAVPPTPPGAVQ